MQLDDFNQPTPTTDINDHDEEHVERARTLSSRLIYEAIRRSGEEELARSNRGLIWSGLAAGLMISFSIIGEASLRTYLPDAGWRPLVENFGYSLGFIVVILGRLQLFTENTITTVLPAMSDRTLIICGSVARLWGIVLAANVAGAFAAAALFGFTGAIPAEIVTAMEAISHHAVGLTPMEAFVRAIPAGIIIAALVWMMPQAEAASFFLILVFTWLIAVCDFAHVVAGSVELAYLILAGEVGWIAGFAGYFLPVLLGNVIGGTVIFTLMAWGQVRDEVIAD